MINDCLQIFEENFKEKGERLILDNYRPKDGTYILVEMKDGEWIIEAPVIIRYDKKNHVIIGKENTNYQYICFLDYNSKLVAMNKPMDSFKIIHTNNYLSFAVREESVRERKLTSMIINGYYDTLCSPRQKYKKPKVRTLYDELVSELGEPDVELAERIRAWILEHIDKLEVDLRQKDYLKIFFVYPDKAKTERLFEKEGKRYLIPNIYNNNDFNRMVNDEIYGLPSNNLNMNAKKPYLPNKTRKVETPYLLNKEDVILQGKFYDYLMGLASKGYYNVLFDNTNNKIIACRNGESPEHNLSGYFLRLRNGKEVEIHDADVVVAFDPNIKPLFHFKKILDTDDTESHYGPISRRKELEMVIDDVFFSKMLINNYFTQPEDINITDNTLTRTLLDARESLFVWFYKETDFRIDSILQQVGGKLTHNSMCKGYWKKAKTQMNLKWSLMDYFNQNNKMEETMGAVREQLREHMDCREDWEFSNPQEYYYAVGQLVSYLISKSRALKKPLAFINPFLNAKDDEVIKKKLSMLFKQYNYAIFVGDVRLRRMYAAVKEYIPGASVDFDMLEAGFVANNLIYEKKKEEK